MATIASSGSKIHSQVKSIFQFTIILIMVLLFSLPIRESKALSKAKNLDRLEITPDLMQTDKRASLPYAGRAHCGPVAASNGLIWLANAGYPKLSISKNPTIPQQGKLAIEIGTMMNTTRKGGTTINGFIKGLSKYIKSKGYKIDKLNYQGWEQCDRNYFTGIKKPRPYSIFDSFDDRTCVWLKIGWYKYFPAKKEYVRFAGHFVNVVAIDKTNKQLIIHDSAPRSGIKKQSDKVSIEKIESGKLVSGWVKPFDTNSMYKLNNQLKVKKKADCGLLDGIIYLKMK